MTAREVEGGRFVVERLGGDRREGMMHNGVVEALARARAAHAGAPTEQPQAKGPGLTERDKDQEIERLRDLVWRIHLEVGGDCAVPLLRRVAERCAAEPDWERGRLRAAFREHEVKRALSALDQLQAIGPEAEGFKSAIRLVLTSEPDWEGKGEPQGERGRVGRLLGIRRGESIVDAARRARERIEALEGELHLARGVGEEWKRAYDNNVSREDDVRAVLGAARDESTLDAARRAGLTDCPSCGDERPLAECSTCSFDEGASDDVGPGERRLLREVLGAEEGESLVAAAHRVWAAAWKASRGGGA